MSCTEGNAPQSVDGWAHHAVDYAVMAGGGRQGLQDDSADEMTQLAEQELVAWELGLDGAADHDLVGTSGRVGVSRFGGTRRVNGMYGDERAELDTEMAMLAELDTTERPRMSIGGVDQRQEAPEISDEEKRRTMELEERLVLRTLEAMANENSRGEGWPCAWRRIRRACVVAAPTRGFYGVGDSWRGVLVRINITQ